MLAFATVYTFLDRHRSVRSASPSLHRLDGLQTPREMSKLGDCHSADSRGVAIGSRFGSSPSERVGEHSMRIEQIELRIVRLPLVRPFQTSSSRKDHLDHILVRVVADGAIGWGECASPSDPYYCPETTETCWHILRDFLAPLVLGRDWSTIDELVGFYRPVKGNRFARAGLEMACWDPLARSQATPLHSLLGGTRAEILSGVSLGIESRIEPLLDQIARYLEEGYRRIKLKIAPGWDVDVVRRVRDRYPAIPLQVDANSAYTLDDLPALKALDDFGLLLIEQPLADDDIIDHARLQAALKTPICLDESIHSADDARKALDLGACRVINIKVSRLGGLLEAKRVHDLCLRARRARLVRRHARVRHRPGGQRRDRLVARFHDSRRCLGLGQVLCRRHRRAADPGPSRGDRGLRRTRPGRRAGSRSGSGADDFASSRSRHEGGPVGSLQSIWIALEACRTR